MSAWSAFRSWSSERAGALKLALGVAVLLVLAAIVMVPAWNAPAEDRGVIAEWNETIARLGIDPVFPPEEDIYVGDVLAVITNDRRPGKDARAQPLLNRAIKLTHIDMSTELNLQYGTLPVFPETEKRPADRDDPWPQKQASSPPGLFGAPAARSILAIAAFPGFTIRHERGASGGLSAAAAGLFGASRQDSDVVEVKIPFAETYGLPSLLATGRLARFCGDPFTKAVCTDETLRKHLSYVNPAVLLKDTDPETGRVRYVVDVEIALVNRVYLTRSIEQTRRLGRGTAASLDALAKTQRPADAPTPADAASVQKRTEDLVARLDPAVPGGSVSVTTTSDRQYELKQTFQRPIVIGYRAVRTAFPDNLDLPDDPRRASAE
jgi:hypothetical protein